MDGRLSGVAGRKPVRAQCSDDRQLDAQGSEKRVCRGTERDDRVVVVQGVVRRLYRPLRACGSDGLHGSVLEDDDAHVGDLLEQTLEQGLPVDVSVDRGVGGDLHPGADGSTTLTCFVTGQVFDAAREAQSFRLTSA
ncbi:MULTISPECIES: hypothetical protein [Rhodococcus]|uniref:Uncharacterized protein n=1 Tax=Rhodococcus opacus RKJ300 = JCM 13270 TaxID=1165867 RepID=I0WLX1_RHOOP|nr:MULTISPECIES: hypothetical protein [Rhodococcus]EID77387.1 hypothetical protein W59_24245 [Rhodococcus opacus RKJ300 = JCM 13270]QQZ18142.1 hypothetical protein GO592_10605 [Rhodococcus sp. 21391]